ALATPHGRYAAAGKQRQSYRHGQTLRATGSTGYSCPSCYSRHHSTQKPHRLNIRAEVQGRAGYSKSVSICSSKVSRSAADGKALAPDGLGWKVSPRLAKESYQSAKSSFCSANISCSSAGVPWS